MDIKRQAFENLWLAGGGSLDNFIFSEDQGKYAAIENSNLTDKQKEMALYVVNNAYLFFVGGFKQAAKAQVPEWISVNDQMPPIDETVLVCWDHAQDIEPEKEYVTTDENLDEYWPNCQDEPPTHWMPLPKVIEAQEQSHD